LCNWLLDGGSDDTCLSSTYLIQKSLLVSTALHVIAVTILQWTCVCLATVLAACRDFCGVVRHRRIPCSRPLYMVSAEWLLSKLAFM